LKHSHDVRLQPYARIEGELKIGARIGAHESIRLGLAHFPYAYHPRMFPPLSLFLTGSTDDHGRVVFRRVPPIAVEVYHEPKVRDAGAGPIAQSQTTKFVLKAGEVHHLSLGGKGRPVIGRLAVSGYEGTIDYRAGVYSLETILPQLPELPDLMALS